MSGPPRHADSGASTAQAGRRLPPVIFTLGWISFLTDVASEMVYPLIPLFLATTLGAPALALGAVEGVSEAVISLLRGWAGWKSDAIRRRIPFVRWGYALGAAGKPLLALAFAWPMVLGARVVDRIGKGLRTPPRDALIADVVAAPDRGRAFGFHRAMDTAGALVGGLVVIALLQFLPAGYRTIFAIATIPAILSVALTFRLREPAGGSPEEETAPDSEPPKSNWRETLSFPPAYWTSLAMMLLFTLGNSSDTFLLLRAKGLGLSDTAVVLAYTVFNLTTALLAYPAGAMSDRFGRWRVMGVGWLLYAVVYFGFAITGTAGVWGLLALYGAFMAMTHGVGRALVADHAPPDRRGTAMGLFFLATGLMTILGNLLAGWLWDNVSPTATFWFGGVIALAAAASIPLVAPRMSSPPADQ